MYNDSYDDYIRSVLGYPSFNNNTTFENEYEFEYENSFSSQTDELEEFYPEIYRIVYPMVTKACDNCREAISRETIENMVNEVYSNLEEVNEIKQEENRIISNNSKEIKSTIKEPVNREKRIENRAEDRQFRNRNLRDLIQILIIRELLRRRRFPGQRPRPPRPPFPGRTRRLYETTNNAKRI